MVSVAPFRERFVGGGSPAGDQGREAVVGREVHVPDVQNWLFELPSVDEPGHRVGDELFGHAPPLRVEGAGYAVQRGRLAHVLHPVEGRSAGPAQHRVEEPHLHAVSEVVGRPIELPALSRGELPRGRARSRRVHLEAELLQPLAHDRVAAGEALIEELFVAAHRGELASLPALSIRLLFPEPLTDLVFELVEPARPRRGDRDLPGHRALALHPFLRELSEESPHLLPADHERPGDLSLGAARAVETIHLVGEVPAMRITHGRPPAPQGAPLPPSP